MAPNGERRLGQAPDCPALTTALRGRGPAGKRGRWSPAEHGAGSRLHGVQCDFLMQGESRVLCVL